MGFKESETVELKKSLTALKEGLISISAILNKNGAGELWFGIAPNGKPEASRMDARAREIKHHSEDIRQWA